MAEKKPKPDPEAEVLAKVGAFSAPFRAMGERLHRVILDAAPTLKPKVWYGMPGYAAAGPVLCFFRVDDGLMTFGLTEKAKHEVEAGAKDQLVASAWFFTGLDEATEQRIAGIVKRAVG